MKYKFKDKFIKQYSVFLKSDCFKNTPDYSKSEYWEYHASQVNIKIEGNTIHASGKSGFYVSTNKGIYETFKKILLTLKNPLKITSLLKRVIGISPIMPGIKLLNIFDAFDKVMKGEIISAPQLSPNRINFSTMIAGEIFCTSAKCAKLNYSKIASGNSISDHMMMAYYYLNILKQYTDINKKKNAVILEIGGGNGNLMSLIKRNIQGATFIDVDLPETISHAILFLKSQFPNAKILMPNEVHGASVQFCEYDFVFLTPSQIHLIPDSIVDISINNHSFQEMTYQMIDEYFHLIQRAGKNKSYFFTANRVEKIPTGPCLIRENIQDRLPIRFSEYPWNGSNELIIYEICRLLRLVQLDSIFNRLERIIK
jgi:putative sugar O-methyltransferase